MSEHGNTGKRNAAIDDEPLTQAFVKMPRKQKAEIVNHCQRRGVKFSVFMREAASEKMINDALAELDSTNKVIAEIG